MTKILLLIVITSLIIKCEGSLEDDYYLIAEEDDNVDRTRVAAGADSLPRENLDYARLTIAFQNTQRQCGGTLLKGLYVLTTASCVNDPFEGEAYAVNISFPQNLRLLGQKLRIFSHPEFNYTTKVNDIAVIQMDQPISPDSRLVDFSALPNKTEEETYEGKILRFCGMGTTQNYPNFSNTLKCTDLQIVPSTNCSMDMKNILCSSWKFKDNNVCGGDYGGPLYEFIDDGVNKRQVLVGIASHSPDSRHGAPCLDAHKVIFTKVSAYLPLIEQFIGTSLKSYSLRGRDF